MTNQIVIFDARHRVIALAEIQSTRDAYRVYSACIRASRRRELHYVPLPLIAGDLSRVALVQWFTDNALLASERFECSPEAVYV